MKRLLSWFWNRGVLSTFMTGLFVVLPLGITAVLMSWLGGKIWELMKPDAPVGGFLVRIGLTRVSNERAALVVGIVVVLAAIWVLGLVIKATARHRFDEIFHGLVNRVPLVSAVYKPVSQVVGLMKQDDKSDMKGMSVVYCSFGSETGGGFLGLLASSERYHIGGHECQLIYIPTSPVPMSGGLVFVPSRSIKAVELSVDDVMKIYFSLGVLSSQVIPEAYKRAPASA